MPDFDEAASVEAMARALWDAYLKSPICKPEYEGIAWETIKEYAPSRPLINDVYQTGLAEAQAALAALKPYLGGISASKESLHAIPEGWALVPIKPTEEMVWVGRESIDTCTKLDPCDKAAEHCWADMLSAAPSPGHTESG